jgi:DNA-directed RNA polymerase specialized sigma24 family protein
MFPKMSSHWRESCVAKAALITQEQNSLLGAFFRDHAAWLRQTLRLRWGQRAEDIVQEVFFFLRLHPNKLLRISSPRGWLLRTGQRMACNNYRSECRKSRLHRAAHFLADEYDPESEARRTAAKRTVALAIRKMRGELRIACARRYLKSESLEAIAKKLDHGTGTIYRSTRSFLEKGRRGR